jgi:hypothetical protein
MRLANKFSSIGANRLHSLSTGGASLYTGSGTSSAIAYKSLSTSPFNFYNLDIGEPADNRVLIITTSGLLQNTYSPTCTVNGSGATRHARAIDSTSTGTSIFTLPLSTGSTANVTINNGSGNEYVCGIAIYAGYNINATPFHTATDISGTNTNGNVNVNSGGMVIASAWVINVNPASQNFTAGVTRDMQRGIDPPFTVWCVHSAGSYFPAISTETPRTVTHTASGESSHALAVASFDPL